jgi:hypothetical protein
MTSVIWVFTHAENDQGLHSDEEEQMLCMSTANKTLQHLK